MARDRAVPAAKPDRNAFRPLFYCFARPSGEDSFGVCFTMITQQLSADLERIPDLWRSELQLASGETVIAALEPDLDARLHFVKSVLLVTERRLMARTPQDTAWRHWTYRPGLTLTHIDHAGVGHLQLQDDHGRLASWSFTLGQNLLAIRLVDQFGALLEGHVSEQSDS
jgi:ATP-binding cassette subfamily B protein